MTRIYFVNDDNDLEVFNAELYGETDPIKILQHALFYFAGHTDKVWSKIEIENVVEKS